MMEWNLTKRFGLLTVSLLLAAGVILQWSFVRQERSALEMRLREKVDFVQKFYAFLITDSLQRKDDVSLLQIVNRLEEDPEITSVVVVDNRGEVRYHTDTQKIGSLYDDPLVKSVLQAGEGSITNFQNAGGPAMALVAPLKTQGQPRPIGAVRIDLTYRHIQMQIAAGWPGFVFVLLSLLVGGAGIALWFVKQWIWIPMQTLRTSIASISPVSLESASLPQTKDDLAGIHQALHDLVGRFKSHRQNEQDQTAKWAEQEKAWVEQLLGAFLPGARAIIADKDNRVLADTGNGTASTAVSQHLLDLITDSQFATLVSDAIRHEGEVRHGQANIGNKLYQASALSVPAHQSIVVKTLIALRD